MQLDSIFQPLLTYLVTFSFVLFNSPRYSLTFNHPTDPPALQPRNIADRGGGSDRTTLSRVVKHQTGRDKTSR